MVPEAGKREVGSQTWTFWVQEKEPRYVCVSEGTHTKRGLRFLPLLYTSYIKGYWSAPISKNIFSGCCVQ